MITIGLTEDEGWACAISSTWRGLEGMRAAIFAVTLGAKNRVKAIRKTLSSVPFKN
jgi:hypothetical protein